MEEIFEFALYELRRSGLSGSLGAGIVVTGGFIFTQRNRRISSRSFSVCRLRLVCRHLLHIQV